MTPFCGWPATKFNENFLSGCGWETISRSTGNFSVATLKKTTPLPRQPSTANISRGRPRGPSSTQSCAVCGFTRQWPCPAQKTACFPPSSSHIPPARSSILPEPWRGWQSLFRLGSGIPPSLILRALARHGVCFEPPNQDDASPRTAGRSANLEQSS